MKESELSAMFQDWPREAPFNALLVPALWLRIGCSTSTSPSSGVRRSVAGRCAHLFVLCVPETGSGPGSAPSGRSEVL